MTSASRVTIRRAEEDHPAILQLQKETLPDDYPLVPDGQTVWWLAWCAGEPVGFASLSPSKRWKDFGYLSRSGVVESMRGRGIQKRFIKVRIKYAIDAGWDWLSTDTVNWNSPSNNSLISCGFRTYNPEKPYGGEHTIYWRLRLKTSPT